MVKMKGSLKKNKKINCLHNENIKKKRRRTNKTFEFEM